MEFASLGQTLMVFAESVCQALGNNGNVDLDISKAFDSIWHDGVLYKLKGYDISVRNSDSIQSFASNREMKVVLEDHCSRSFSLTWVVPQGFICEPICF